MSGRWPAKVFSSAGHEFQTLQRIQAQGGKGCVRCQVGQSCAGQGAGVLADGGKSGLAKSAVRDAQWKTPRLRRAVAGTLDRQAAVFGKGLEFAGQERRATGMALDLAAGGFGNRAASHQHDRVQRQAMLIEHRPANRIQHRREIDLSVARDLLHQNEALAAVVVHDKSGPVAGFQQRVTPAGRGLDILRIAVQAADDDQVVPSAGDVELALAHEAQVAGPQERAFARVAQAGVEGTAGLVGLVPVSLADRRSGNPDFAHAAGGGLRVGLRVDDHHAQIADGRSAGHQATSLRRIVGHGLDAVLGQRRVVEGPTVAPLPRLGPLTMSVASAKP